MLLQSSGINEFAVWWFGPLRVQAGCWRRQMRQVCTCRSESVWNDRVEFWSIRSFDYSAHSLPNSWLKGIGLCVNFYSYLISHLLFLVWICPSCLSHRFFSRKHLFISVFTHQVFLLKISSIQQVWLSYEGEHALRWGRRERLVLRQQFLPLRKKESQGQNVNIIKSCIFYQ